MFQTAPLGLEKLNSDYSFVAAYVRSPRLSSLTVAVAMIPLAALDIAYHTTALVLKSLRAVAYTAVLSKTVLKTGPRQHFLPIRNALIAAVAYPIIGTFSSRSVLRMHDYFAPKPDRWEFLRTAAAIVGIVSVAGVLKWLCKGPLFKASKPMPTFSLPLIAVIGVVGGLLGGFALKKGCSSSKTAPLKPERLDESDRKGPVPDGNLNETLAHTRRSFETQTRRVPNTVPAPKAKKSSAADPWVAKRQLVGVGATGAVVLASALGVPFVHLFGLATSAALTQWSWNVLKLRISNLEKPLTAQELNIGRAIYCLAIAYLSIGDITGIINTFRK